MTTETKDFPITHAALPNLTRRVSVAAQEERMIKAHKLGAKKRSVNFIRQAIVTKFLGPTNFRGSRVKATAYANSVTLSWDYALNSDDNHKAAAKALAAKLVWKGEWIGGGMPDNSGHCYVLADSASFTV